MIADARIHLNTSPSRLKAFAANVKEVRFVVDVNTNRMHMANAANFIHLDIREEAGIDYHNNQIHGYAHCDNNGDFFVYISRNDDHDFTSEVLVPRFVKVGFEETNKAFDFVW